ncbi:hypothetical protein ABT294_21635 [Nonomuraea sp. NPDC000554]|uniref:hypothetical protein n=1 Tax=Nonomuraea sp. NPDC000554 TaxID=3154259 RepID=UPI00331D22C3
MTCVLSACVLPGTPAAADDGTRKLFTFRDPRITESSGLAVSPTRDGIYYTHNDSSAEPVFYAVGEDGRTRATYRLQGAQARDWEAMAASKDPETGRGVLWFADIGDNLDGAWPDVSVYKVMEPTSLHDATLPAVRYRFRYEGGGRNAEGIMVHPRTGRLYVVSKEFSGSVYEAPSRLRTSGTNKLRKIGSAPIMATDAAYAPDGSSYVIRTYFSATLYRPDGHTIAKLSMPELKQAESIAYTRDGKALLTGSEGVDSPVYRVPLPDAEQRSSSPEPTLSPAADRADARKSPDVAVAAESGGLTGRDILIWLAAAAGATGVIVFLARRTR